MVRATLLLDRAAIVTTATELLSGNRIVPLHTPVKLEQRDFGTELPEGTRLTWPDMTVSVLVQEATLASSISIPLPPPIVKHLVVASVTLGTSRCLIGGPLAAPTKSMTWLSVLVPENMPPKQRQLLPATFTLLRTTPLALVCRVIPVTIRPKGRLGLVKNGTPRLDISAPPKLTFVTLAVTSLEGRPWCIGPMDGLLTLILLFLTVGLLLTGLLKVPKKCLVSRLSIPTAGVPFKNIILVPAGTFLAFLNIRKAILLLVTPIIRVSPLPMAVNLLHFILAVPSEYAVPATRATPAHTPRNVPAVTHPPITQ